MILLAWHRYFALLWWIILLLLFLLIANIKVISQKDINFLSDFSHLRCWSSRDFSHQRQNKRLACAPMSVVRFRPRRSDAVFTSGTHVTRRTSAVYCGVSVDDAMLLDDRISLLALPVFHLYLSRIKRPSVLSPVLQLTQKRMSASCKIGPLDSAL